MKTSRFLNNYLSVVAVIFILFSVINVYSRIFIFVWIALTYILSIKSGQQFIIFISFILFTAIQIVNKNMAYAEKMADTAFFFLIMGFLQEVVRYILDLNKNSTKNNQRHI